MTTPSTCKIGPIANPDRLYFAATLDECRLAAKQQPSELRADPGYGAVDPVPIYTVDMDIPDLQTLLNGPNNSDDLTNSIIIDGRLVETVSD